RARFGPEIDRAGNPEVFYSVLVRLFAALHNSHSGLVLSAGAVADAGMGTELVGDRLLVTRAIADGVLADHGLARGWESSAIAGLPLASWLERRLEFVSASTIQYGRVAAARQATRRFWFEPAERRFTFRSPAGESLTLEVRLDRPLAAGGTAALA